jgi:hypothetical protein
LPRTATGIDRRSSFATARVALLTAMVALTLALVPATAGADGDPASDVLLSQQVFVPWDAGASSQQTARLEAVVAAAGRAGYPARVALIASSSDLGSVTPLWRRPQSYAEFLGIELSLAFHGSVLAVMPNGIGVYRAGVPTAVARAALARSRVARGGLVAVAAAGVEALAAAAGHPVPPLALRSPAGQPASRTSGHDVTAWVVFALGTVLILLAWSASLRARPFGRTTP